MIFDEKKASQAAAYILFCAGGRLPVLTLIKLLYLSERRSYQLYSEPMIGDRLVSMSHGPVLSNTYNLMGGDRQSAAGGWNHWMKSRVGNEIGLKHDVLSSPQDELLELSDADLAILEQVWREVGHMSPSEVRDYTRGHCAEWRDPQGSMIPIAYEDLFDALDFTQQRKEQSLALLQERADIARAFKRDFA
jgi:uncharacterized phage-associated protein